jgi:flagellar protein FlaG
MEKAITTALLVIASIIAAIALTNSVLPAVGRSTGAVLTSSAEVAGRVKTDLSIVFASGNTSSTEITYWTKNVGLQEILGADKSDLFLTTPTVIKRIDHLASCSSESPDCWSYSFEGGATNWIQATTIRVSVRLITLTTGQHTVRFVVPNGVSAEKVFSI